MNSIKFSHRYPKLYKEVDGVYADEIVLMDVIDIKLEKLSEKFLFYDTNFGEYKLPKKGDYLMLIFKKTEYDIFTTLRRRTPEKERYYRSKIGEVFEIEYMEGKNEPT